MTRYASNTSVSAHPDELKRIWLQPACCAAPDDRYWAANPGDLDDCEDGADPVEYVVASEVAAKDAEIERLQVELARRCPECDGTGEVTWPDASCGSGGYAPQAITSAPCRRCTATLTRERDEARALLRVAQCPNRECRDGAVAVETVVQVGEAPDGTPIAGPEIEWEPCQWCDERRAALAGVEEATDGK